MATRRHKGRGSNDAGNDEDSGQKFRKWNKIQEDLPADEPLILLNPIQFRIRAPHSPSSAFTTTFRTAFGSTFNVSFCNWVIDYFWKISILFHKSTHYRLPFWPKTIPVNSPRFPGKFTLCAKLVPIMSLVGF